MIVRFDNPAVKQRKTESNIGIDSDVPSSVGPSEADAIVAQAKAQLADGNASSDSPTDQTLGRSLQADASTLNPMSNSGS